MKPFVADELAALASPEMRNIWSPEANVILEREIWLSVMRAQRLLGLPFEFGVEQDYRDVLFSVDLESIRQRELVTKHDVKARIEEFNALAGHEAIHLGMTSADIVDNAAQIKIRRSSSLLIALYPRRFEALANTMQRYPLRGIKGAVGTMQDQLDLLGSFEACEQLDRWVAADFGFEHTLTNTGQVYPRSLDSEIVSRLLMGVADLDVGLVTILRGFLTMCAGFAGETWNEGDVSTSVIRRVALPGSFYVAEAALLAIDGHLTPA